MMAVEEAHQYLFPRHWTLDLFHLHLAHSLYLSRRPNPPHLSCAGPLPLEASQPSALFSALDHVDRGKRQAERNAQSRGVEGDGMIRVCRNVDLNSFAGEGDYASRLTLPRLLLLLRLLLPLPPSSPFALA